MLRGFIGIDAEIGARGPAEEGVPNGSPGLPSWAVGLALGATLAAFDAQYSRGNENNADPAGKVPGYAVVALDGSWNITKEWQLFARVDNLFNRTYQNFGILGANYFRGPGNTFDASLAGPEAFRSPGAPFGAWIGIQYRLDRRAGSR